MGYTPNYGPKKAGYKLTQEQYARIYNVHPNTVSRWQKKRLPLDDPENLLVSLLMQRTFTDNVLGRSLEEMQRDHAQLVRSSPRPRRRATQRR